MFFLPEARVRKAVTSNAGVYMIPTITGYGEENYGYPHSLGGTPFTDDDIATYFATPMIVHLGIADTIRDTDFPTDEAAEAQGNTRLARGHFFFNYAREAAEAAGVPFNWQLVEVPGIAHDSRGMARTPVTGVADLLYEDRK